MSLLRTIWQFLTSWRADLKARTAKYLVTREVVKALQLTHAQELMSTPRNEWAIVRQKQVEEIRAVQSGQQFDTVDRRSWAYPYLPEALHRLNQPILKNTPYNLRRFSETPIPRRAMNIVKNAVLSFKWQIKPTKDFVDDIDPDREQRVRIATETLKRPNETGESFRDLFEQVIEDFLLNGAGCIEHRITPYFKRPTKFWAVDSSTIRLFLDWTESTPDRPRYAQMTGLKGERGIVTFLTNELYYIRDNIRTSTPFGLGRLEVAFQCYSDDTEVLTKHGWKFWKDVKHTDKFATRSEDGKFEWQRATELYKKKYNGNMVHFSSQGTDALVTPNHRMFGWQTLKHVEHVPDDWGGHIKGSGLRDAPLEFMKAEDVANLYRTNLGYPFRVPTTSNWEGKLPEGFKDGKVKLSCVHDFGYEGWNKDIWINLKDWVAFLGLYVGQGCAAGNMRGIDRKKKKPIYIQAMAAAADTSIVIPHRNVRGYLVHIAHGKKRSNYKKVRALLDRLPFGFDGRSYTNNKTLHSIVAQCGNVYTKKVPGFIKSLPPEYINIFLSWASEGDGQFYNKDKTLREYTTVSKRLADDMQELYQKVGSSASVRKYKVPKAIFNGRRVKSTAPCIYWVIERGSDWDTLGKVKWVPYTGYVYCASVPNKILYVRRNGFPLWCGNSVNAFLGVQDMSTRAGSDQVHKTWLWWEQALNPAHINLVRRHITNELEGQAKVSLIAGAKKPEVVEVTPVTPEDLLLDWQKFLIQIIAAAFDLSPQALNMDDHPARATAQVMATADWRTAVVPVATRFQEAWTRLWLHDTLGWKDLEFEFDNLDDPDPVALLVILQRMYSMNAIIPNEIRKKMGLGPLPGPFGKLTQAQMQLIIMEAQAMIGVKASSSMPNPGGSMGMGSSPGSLGTGMAAGAMDGMLFATQDVAGMDPQDVQLYQELGLLPPSDQLMDQMDQQQPGILDQLSTELQQYFQNEIALKRAEEVEPAPVTRGEEQQQIQKYQADQHQESLAEFVINRRGVFGPAVNSQVRKNPLRGKYPRSSSGGFVDQQAITQREEAKDRVLQTGKPKKRYNPGKGNNAY